MDQCSAYRLQSYTVGALTGERELTSVYTVVEMGNVRTSHGLYHRYKYKMHVASRLSQSTVARKPKTYISGRVLVYSCREPADNDSSTYSTRCIVVHVVCGCSISCRPKQIRGARCPFHVVVPKCDSIVTLLTRWHEPVHCNRTSSQKMPYG